MPHLLSYRERERLAPFLPALALTPEEIAVGECARVENQDPERLVCLCGNHKRGSSFISATVKGIALQIDGTQPRHEALAEWPEDSAEVHLLCRECGRLYREQTIYRTNTAPVVRIVDLTDGTPAKNAVIAHDAEMMDTETTTPKAKTVKRLYANDNGMIACAEHGGTYLSSSILERPRAKLHRTPLGTWERFSGPTGKA